MDERKFEDRWKDAMTGAEALPSVSVWSSVESALIASENTRMKGLVVFYQRLAAACILFALGLGAFGYYYGSNRGGYPGNLVFRKAPDAATDKRNSFVPPDSADKPSLFSETAKVITKEYHREPTPPITKPLQQESVVKKMTTMDQSNNNSGLYQINQDTAQTITRPGTDVAAARKTESVVQQVTQSSVAVPVESPIKINKKKEEHTEIAGLTKTSDEPEKLMPEKKRGENIWASLGMSAGNYNPGSIASSAPTAAYGNVASSQGSSSTKPAPGTAYSIGLAMGKKVADRWVLQAGINYLNQSTAYTSNVTANTGSYPMAMDLFNISSNRAPVTFTNPYQINSTLEFISVPVQAGYLLVDRKVGLQMNAGVATDFFIRNSLEDQSGQSNSYSQGAGADSPYRSVNWAGLVSSELSYKLGRQYRVSLVPGVRYLFNSSLKSGATTNSYMTDIGFRFRYILR